MADSSTSGEQVLVYTVRIIAPNCAVYCTNGGMTQDPNDPNAWVREVYDADPRTFEISPSNGYILKSITVTGATKYTISGNSVTINGEDATVTAIVVPPFSVNFEGDVNVEGNIKQNGTAVALSGHTHTADEVGAVGRSMAGQSVKPTSSTTVTAYIGAEVFNDYRERTFNSTVARSGNVACGQYSHAEGGSTTASDAYAHAEGNCTIASGLSSHSEGYNTKVTGQYSHAEGSNTNAGNTSSHAEGNNTSASGECSHTEGRATSASGLCSHAEGSSTVAGKTYSHAEGYGTKASAKSQHAGGAYNVEYTDETSKFIIGKGTSNTARANCFRVTDTGTYASGNYNASGADYAELFEWEDGNPENEDRAGLFVTLDGDKLRLATPEDDYILGVVSGNPSIVGDVHDDQWAGMYLYDVFGRPLWEDVEVPDETIEEPDPENPGQTVTRVIIPAHTEHRQKLNPDYDGTQPYTARSQRPEWDAVGLMGKLVAVDDGTCQVNGWCKPAEGGIATASEARTKYRVMKRLDETHVQLMILP